MLVQHGISPRDVVGIGALNLDYITTKSRLLDRDPSVMAEFSGRFEPGHEQKVSPEVLRETRAVIGEACFDVWLGGSAFNVIQALRSAAPELKLGYVGASGAEPGAPSRFQRWFNTYNVDDSFVHHAPDTPNGACVSFISEGERSMLTTRGANDLVVHVLRERREDICRYLASAKCLHLTSFFDPESPSLILSVIQQVKQINPGVLVSFDPGHEWCRQHSTDPAILGLLKLSDILLVNADEFKLLGGPITGGDETTAASRIISKCNDSSTLILQKSYNRISVFFRVFRRGVVRRDFVNEALPREEIEDATGAGDVFAAGILLGHLLPGFQLDDAIRLALRMVRRKLVASGTRNFDKFLGLVEEVADEITGSPQEKSIFIGHGRDAVWRQIETHLRGKLNFNVKLWESESRVNKFPINVLSEFLDSASFAILVLTGEDTTEEGRTRARQNVLHEMGLFQGRLGFNKVIVMRDENIEVPSNIEGWQSIILRRENMERTLIELENSLRIAKLI